MLTRAIHPHAPRASENVSPWYNLQHDAASLRLRSAAGRFLVHSSQEGAPPSVPTTHGRLACRVSYGQCVVHEPACCTPFLARSASCAALCAALCVREPGAAAVRSASRCRSLARTLSSCRARRRVLRTESTRCTAESLSPIYARVQAAGADRCAWDVQPECRRCADARAPTPTRASTRA